MPLQALTAVAGLLAQIEQPKGSGTPKALLSPQHTSSSFGSHRNSADVHVRFSGESVVHSSPVDLPLRSTPGGATAADVIKPIQLPPCSAASIEHIDAFYERSRFEIDSVARTNPSSPSVLRAYQGTCLSVSAPGHLPVCRSCVRLCACQCLQLCITIWFSSKRSLLHHIDCISVFAELASILHSSIRQRLVLLTTQRDRLALRLQQLVARKTTSAAASESGLKKQAAHSVHFDPTHTSCSCCCHAQPVQCHEWHASTASRARRQLSPRASQRTSQRQRAPWDPTTAISYPPKLSGLYDPLWARADRSQRSASVPPRTPACLQAVMADAWTVQDLQRCGRAPLHSKASQRSAIMGTVAAQELVL